MWSFVRFKCLGKPVCMLHEQYRGKFLYGGGGGVCTKGLLGLVLVVVYEGVD